MSHIRYNLAINLFSAIVRHINTIVGYLLKEDGDSLLKEDGDKLGI